MTRLRVMLARLLGTLSGRRREDELREELDTHLELLADEHRRRGLSDAEARLAARRELGGVAQTREAFRDTRVLPGIDALRQDVRFAWRALMRDRSTTLAAIALLTVGVSSTVVLADVLDRLLLRPPTHVDDPARVRRLYEDYANGTRPSAMVSNYITYERLAAGTTAEIEAIAPFQEQRIGSGRGPDASRLQAIAFGPAYFDVLALRPRLGVLPSARQPANDDAVVISHALWQQRFGGALDVIGKTLRLGQRTHTIVAVTPRGFAGIDDDPVDVWAPLAARDKVEHWRTTEGSYYLRAVARLRPGVDRRRAEAHASQVFNAVHKVQTMDGTRPSYRLVLGELLAGQEPVRSRQTTVLMAVGAVSALVLLMACGNVGNLLILSGLRRSQELALKAALGATRARLLREVFIQAIVLALLAGAGALSMVLTVGGLVRRVLLPPLAATAAPIDARLVLLTVGICGTAALALGLVPAGRLSATRVAAPGPGARSTSPSRLIDTFVGLQVALSVPLLVGTGLFTVSLWKALSVDFGQETDRVTVVHADFADDGRPQVAHAAHRRIQARLQTLPGVTAVSMVQGAPSLGGYAAPVFPDTGPRGHEAAPMVNAVDPSFFEALGLRLAAGRAFREADNRPTAPRVAVVNEALARRFWPGQPAVGRCLHVWEWQPNPPCTEVVGVVAKAPWFTDINATPADLEPLLLLPIERFSALSPQRALVVRTTAPARAAMVRVRQEAQRAAALLPYVDAVPYDEEMDFQYRPLRLGMSIFLGLSAVALVIAVVGLAVVTAHGVTRRTREMGIRLVLGAEPRDLVRLMACRTLAAMAIGLAAGAVMAYAGAGLLKTVLFGIEPGDPRIFAGAMAVLLLVGGIAAWIPARRTGRIEPSAALRIE
jgi:putative ABC transport system permease protein